MVGVTGKTAYNRASNLQLTYIMAPNSVVGIISCEWNPKGKAGHGIMKGLKGSQTEKNLVIAFAGESQARNRYNYFAGAARKEGLMQIADIYAENW